MLARVFVYVGTRIALLWLEKLRSSSFRFGTSSHGDRVGVKADGNKGYRGVDGVRSVQ